MDLKDAANKSALIKEISVLCGEYEQFLLSLANSKDAADYHKAAILYYWFREYKNMLRREKKFNPCFLKKYSRGDVIQVDLGFNPGSEQGGRHYAIVLEDNPRSFGTVTIIPLRSQKAKDANGVHWSELSLGNEIYTKVNTKIVTLRKEYAKNLAILAVEDQRVDAELKVIEALIGAIGDSLPSGDSVYDLRKNALARKADIAQKKRALGSDRLHLSDCLRQFSSMKSGSVALVRKVTTVSKLRIITPTKEDDPLADIKISKAKMDEISELLIKFYLPSGQV